MSSAPKPITPIRNRGITRGITGTGGTITGGTVGNITGTMPGGTITGGTVMTGSGGTTTSSGNTYSYTFVWSGNTGCVMSTITDPPDQGNWRGKVKGLIRVS